MLRTRVIPCLLLSSRGLVKTIRFARAKYVGDPINTVKIFNEKEADELILLDIDASRQGREPKYDLLSDIVSEAFMPIAYGGGIANAEQARRVVGLGIEKVILNSAAIENPQLVGAVAAALGSSSTVVALDAKTDWLGRRRLFDPRARRTNPVSLDAHAKRVVALGAGEIFVNSVDRDGMGRGMDLELIRRIAAAVDVPVIACGGAGGIGDLREAARAGAAGVAAGSMFVYLGPHRAVMINYPAYDALESVLNG